LKITKGLFEETTVSNFDCWWQSLPIPIGREL